MESGIARSAIILILASVIFSSYGCSSKQTQDFPRPELKFPGVNDVAVHGSSEDTAAIISSLTGHLSTAAVPIPYGQFVSPILTAVSKLMGLLEKPEIDEQQFVDQSLGIQALMDIKAKVVTIKNRLRAVGHDMKKGRSYNTPIQLAVQRCEEILKTFHDGSSSLHKNGNYMFTSPALVSFAGVYAGVTGLTFDFFPDRQRHMIDEMKLLRDVLLNYAVIAINRRLAYAPIVREEICSRPSPCEYFCSDRFFELTPCESCSLAKCEDGTTLNNVSYKKFKEYQTELRNIYVEYFRKPIGHLNAFIRILEAKV